MNFDSSVGNSLKYFAARGPKALKKSIKSMYHSS
jgi:hypothetical protein